MTGVQTCALPILKRVKTESAVSEFRATSFGLQYEFILANSDSKLVQKSIDDVVKAAALTGSQEIAVFGIESRTNDMESCFCLRTVRIHGVKVGIRLDKVYKTIQFLTQQCTFLIRTSEVVPIAVDISTTTGNQFLVFQDVGGFTC